MSLKLLLLATAASATVPYRAPYDNSRHDRPNLQQTRIKKTTTAYTTSTTSTLTTHRTLHRLRGGQQPRVPPALPKWLQKRLPEMTNSPSDPDRATAATLMRKRGIANVVKAAELLRAAHRRDPENAELKLELADAICTVIRIKTNANSLVIEGTQDSPAFKQVWGKLGAEALPLAVDARKAMPSSVKALAVHADAFMFYSSSKGIVKQALTGVGKKYIALAKELCKHPEHDSCVGEVFLGGFFNVAPWPVGSKQKAASHLAAGAKRAPTKRNLYYVAVVAYQMGDYAKAKDAFARAIKTPVCKDPSSTEMDIADFLAKESQRGLRLAEEALV